jgi:hypothetical protein
MFSFFLALFVHLRVLYPCHVFCYVTHYGHAMAQAVSRQPLTAEEWVLTRVSPHGICGGQSDTGTDFSPHSSVFSSQ